MHPAPDVQECHISIEWLQELIELIDGMPMCRQFIHGAGEIRVCCPEPLIAHSADGVFVTELIVFEPGTSRCRAQQCREHDGARFVKSLPGLAEMNHVLPTCAES